MRLLWLLLLAPPGTGVPNVPRELRLSFGRGIAYAEVIVRASPGDVGQPDWSPFDRDRDGRWSDGERQTLVDAVARSALSRTSVSVGDRVLPIHALRSDPLPAEFPVDASLALRWHGEIAAPPVPTAFVLYDVPPAPGVIVPARLAVGPGWVVETVHGGRAERRGPRRVEAPLSRPQPIVWGVVAPAP